MSTKSTRKKVNETIKIKKVVILHYFVCLISFTSSLSLSFSLFDRSPIVLVDFFDLTFCFFLSFRFLLDCTISQLLRITR